MEIARTFYISNNGCIRRKIDTQHTIKYLLSNNYTETTNAEIADVLLFFSCGADNVSESIALNTIKDLASRKKSSAKLIIGGCVPGINMSKLLDIVDIAGFIGPRDMNSLDSFFENMDISFSEIVAPTKVSDSVFSAQGLITLEKSEQNIFSNSNNSKCINYEAFKRKSDIIRVAQGCLSKCSFCCIREATGKLSSRSIDEITSQMMHIIKLGQNIFTITGEDTGAYGLDIKSNIVDLLERILSLSDSLELAIMDLNPRWVLPRMADFANIIKGTTSIKHIVAPVQSLSSRILSLMQRGHDSVDGYKFFDMLMLESPTIQLHTHLIVGFPGELPADVDASIDFMRRYPLINYYIYPYNDRPGALSVNMSNKLSTEEINRRFLTLIDVRNEL